MKSNFKPISRLLLSLSIFSCLHLHAKNEKTILEAAIDNATFAQAATPGTCDLPFEISCGDTINGDLAGAENNITNYGRFFETLDGVEEIYKIQLTEASDVTFVLSNLTADLELVLFSSCSTPEGSVLTGRFTIGLSDEVLDLKLDAENTYYLAVEGHDNEIGSYTLSMDCTPLCASSSGIVETFENGVPSDWTFNVSGTGSPDFRRWRFDETTFAVGVNNPGSGNWASFEDFSFTQNEINNIATAITPTVDLSNHENVRLAFDFAFGLFNTAAFTRIIISDSVRTFYYSRDLQNWTTTPTNWLQFGNSQFINDTDNTFDQPIPDGLDISNLTVTLLYNDGNLINDSGLGFGFDNFSLCGDATSTPPTNTNPVVSFTTPIDGASLSNGSDLPIVVNATDNGSISNVRLFLNGTFVRQENFFPYEWAAPNQQDNVLRNLIPGNYTLRVVATDNEGNTSEDTINVTVTNTGSKILNLNSEQSITITTSPDLVSDQLFIENLPTGTYNASIFSLEGSKMVSKSIATESGNYQFDLPFLSTGIYILRLDNSEFSFSKKIVVRN